MPLIRNQLKSDPVTERLTGHSTFEFRKLVAFGWVCAFLGTAAIALFSRGVTAWIAACFSIVTATLGLYRLVKERALLALKTELCDKFMLSRVYQARFLGLIDLSSAVFIPRPLGSP